MSPEALRLNDMNVSCPGTSDQNTARINTVAGGAVLILDVSIANGMPTMAATKPEWPLLSTSPARVWESIATAMVSSSQISDPGGAERYKDRPTAITTIERYSDQGPIAADAAGEGTRPAMRTASTTP